MSDTVPHAVSPLHQLREAFARQEALLDRERCRLAREIHDVLAHTLGTTSVQLTALDGLLAADGASSTIRDRVTALHRLVSDGLDEARDAVRALREDDLALTARLAKLCDLHDAELTVRGRGATPTPAAARALYRVTQEALTNADRHAPGARAAVTLVLDERRVELRIDNERAGVAGPFARTGGGHGLIGMQERIKLIGGHLAVGPTADGWRVRVVLPTVGEPAHSGRSPG